MSWLCDATVAPKNILLAINLSVVAVRIVVKCFYIEEKYLRKQVVWHSLDQIFYFHLESAVE